MITSRTLSQGDETPNGVQYQTVTGMTWTDLLDKILQMRESRDQPATFEHEGRLFQLELKERDYPTPTDQFGHELYPDQILASTVPFLVSEEEASTQGIYEVERTIPLP